MSEIIKDFLNKIKSFDKSVWLAVVFFLSNVISFLMGLDAKNFEQAEIKIIKADTEAWAPKSINFTFASKHGKYYYFLWCAPKNIKDENLIFFKNEREAEKMGYKISKRCKSYKLEYEK